MKKRILLLLSSAVMCLSNLYGQTQNPHQAYEIFRRQAFRSYSAFREKVNEEYAAFVRKAWTEYRHLPAIPRPQDEPPVSPIPYGQDGENPVRSTPITIEDIIPVVLPEPQPTPVIPIQETPQPVASSFSFDFFGTDITVRTDEAMRFLLHGCDENSIADAWTKYSLGITDNLLFDCLCLRKKLHLCDWAYLQMLKKMASSFYGAGTNEATLLTAYLYCQSGYKMRIARTDKVLVMLYASHHAIFDMPYFEIDGDMLYPLNCTESPLQICGASFPSEKPLSLLVATEPTLAKTLSDTRHLQSKRYPEIEASNQTNLNLIRFFDSYPSSMLGDNIMTRWAMYANTPMGETARANLYPVLKRQISGKSQLQAVESLLNFVQTAFTYEYDDKVWGRDRAFFADETLYYPYCDCEDRSILFSRLIRDLLGLQVILVYYPGHLATAVNFTDDVQGDYILLNDKRYVICDPTYINAPVGITMPDMDNRTAKVILLD